MTLPRVSVITPFLNAERFLPEAISSVTNQTVSDWELILIDDGSTDHSRHVALEAVRRDERIKLLDRPDQAIPGAAAARNAGIRAGRGSFLAFLDADDILEPAMLETLLATARAHPEAAMIYGPALWWYPEGERPDWIEWTGDLADRLHRPPRLLRRLILMQDGHVPCTCSVLVRRNAIEIVGGFEEGFRLYEDQTLWVKLFLRYPVFITPVRVSRYRQHSSSISATATERGYYSRTSAHPARATFLAWLADYVSQSGAEAAGLNYAIRLARAPYVDDPTFRNRVDRSVLRTAITAAKFRRGAARALARLW
jgi:glycosyltransferase involved in cell wall biosynthesis